MSLPDAKSLPDPPTDGISALQFIPSSPALLASTSWDGSARVHDTEGWTCELSQSMDSGPLLSLTVLAADLVTGGLDGSIRKLDIPTSTATVVGRHTGEPSKVACSCLSSLDENTVVSAGWNSQCFLWDLRSSSGTPISTVQLPGKAFGMDVQNNRIVVATSGRRICFIDYKGGKAEVVLDRESSLKYQSRCVSFFPDGSGVALGSIEGRVAVEFLQDLGVDSGGKKKYAFKCHRVNDTVYPVNCLTFHPRNNITFATGGCDGTVVTWDGWHKKKLATLPKFQTSIAALAFNHDGSKLAIASSYTFEEGERDHPRDEIFIRPMLDSECQPKAQ
mmetsp:Transcript_8065/g.11715  ORF Transcript_8065/g.11715 Transcript_8065/m.11715 type:complete len:333 (-) Transcript_8065:37-1035(-)